jgi:hypothetical protein
MAVLSVIFGYFCIPELRNRSLEEVERMFVLRVPLRKFREFVSDPDEVGAVITRIEQLNGKEKEVMG